MYLHITNKALYYEKANFYDRYPVVTARLGSCNRGEKTRIEKELKTTVRNQFLESTPIDSRTRNRYWTQFQKFWDRTGLLVFS